MPIAVNIRPSEVLKICNDVLKLGLEATTLQRACLVREQLKKLYRAINPAKHPISLMDINTPPSSVTSGTLLFQTPASHGKSDLSSDGWRIENKEHKQIQEES